MRIQAVRPTDRLKPFDVRTYVRDLGGPSRRTTPARPRGREPDRRRTGRLEVAFVPLAQARALVELYAEKGDPKYERAALKYLARYLTEEKPSLADVAADGRAPRRAEPDHARVVVVPGVGVIRNASRRCSVETPLLH